MNSDRSNIITAPLFKLKDSESENMWDGFEFGFDKSKYFEYFNDFDMYTAAEWSVTSTGSGSRALADEHGGTVLLTTGGTNDNSEELQYGAESFRPAAGRNIWYECRFNISHASDIEYFLGLSDTDTALIDGISDGCYFYGVDDIASINFGTAASSVISAETGLFTTVAATYYKVGFKITGISQVEYWVNNIKQGTIKSNIPSTELRISMAVQTGSGTPRALEVDYIRVVATR